MGAAGPAGAWQARPVKPPPRSPARGSSSPPTRDRLLAAAIGFNLPGWVSLLRENRFAVDPEYWPKAALSTLLSLANSIVGAREQRTYGPAIARTRVEPPLFILGHARSGTSHLHRLLALDERLAYPNAYQAARPHVFLTTEERRAKLFARFLPRTRPMDNMSFSLDTPIEDEVALFNLTGLSPLGGWMFPRHWERFRRTLTLRELSDRELRRWQGAFVGFLKKLTWKYRRPLILKSPQHTARVRLLLRLFPEARFVHIHRDPYAVFQSSRHIFRTLAPLLELQRHDRRHDDERIVQQYATISEAFFADRPLIPSGRFHELRFEDLERDPLGQMAELYEALDLGGFGELEPSLRRYLASLGEYRKTTHCPLEPAVGQRIATAWRRSFDEWGYAT